MAVLDEDGSIASELRESIDEDIEEDELHSNYSLEFDDDDDAPRNGQDDTHGDPGRPPPTAGAEREGNQRQGHQLRLERDTPQNGDHGPRFDARDNPALGVPVGPRSTPRLSPNGDRAQMVKPFQQFSARRHARDDGHVSALEEGPRPDVEESRPEAGHGESSLPIQVIFRCRDKAEQVLTLRSRLDGLLQGDCNGADGDRASATEALTKVTREHAALRESLGDVQQELVAARRKVAQDATARLRGAQQKRARAEARRVQHFEHLGEARRAATSAKTEAKALRERLQDEATELRHTKDMLEAARSATIAAEERAAQCHEEAVTAKGTAEELRNQLADARAEAEEEKRRASAAAREAADAIELCERKRELEVDAATREAASRERAVDEQLKRLPEHHQQLFQAEKDRVVRWEERLAAESASLARREEAHKIDLEVCRAEARRVEAEARARIEEDASRERSSLKEARSALDGERGELLRRVARAEAAAQASAAEASSQRAEVNEMRGRVQAERSALDVRSAMLAPQLRALEEGRAALDGFRREAEERARHAQEKVCRALEMEAGVVEREAALEVKWKEITASRQALKQMEKNLVGQAEQVAEQRKSLALARVRLHEQQMEMTLQMSEIRKALELIKRVDSMEDRPSRRLAVELGTLACDRGEMAARRRAGFMDDNCAADGSRTEPLGPEHAAIVDGGNDGGGGGGVLSDVPYRKTNAEGTEVGYSSHRFAAPCEGTTRSLLAACSRAVDETREAPGAAGIGARAYAEETEARKALEKVRSLIASDGGGWRSASGSYGGDDGGGVGGGADEGGGGGGGFSVQGWARRLHAVAIANGACPGGTQ